jgi:hypothetical protein
VLRTISCWARTSRAACLIKWSWPFTTLGLQTVTTRARTCPCSTKPARIMPSAETRSTWTQSLRQSGRRWEARLQHADATCGLAHDSEVACQAFGAMVGRSNVPTDAQARRCQGNPRRTTTHPNAEPNVRLQPLIHHKPPPDLLHTAGLPTAVVCEPFGLICPTCRCLTGLPTWAPKCD